MDKKIFLKGDGLLKSAVFGANDGIITTFAVVAGVAGAQLSSSVILILGTANLAADAISMGLGDFLGERTQRRLDKIQKHSHHNLAPVWLTGLITFITFIVAGSLPLIPYVLGAIGIPLANPFDISIIFTFTAMFLVGAARTLVTRGHWWLNGLEMLSIGAIAAIAAYGLGSLIRSFV